ncbi:hypothetical protein HispidOSU_020741 [Sigmodon hispidus]
MESENCFTVPEHKVTSNGAGNRNWKHRRKHQTHLHSTAGVESSPWGGFEPLLPPHVLPKERLIDTLQCYNPGKGRFNWCSRVATAFRYCGGVLQCGSPSQSCLLMASQ